ncbi:hypothetical protein BC374_26905 [Ensifer sp. LC13]|nr:hypothetical protein BC362_17755 [Ensifer sp. LC14]OCP03726.1 hypothetical protein BBX50_26900 [Ensifer sp. LC11]OCP03875.1 hypothetical protein BC374_26905 [Ensifer sp. LC13]OCP30289.1 hypothetical protein BC364_26920 [Ensifer sp. LC499]
MAGEQIAHYVIKIFMSRFEQVRANQNQLTVGLVPAPAAALDAASSTLCRGEAFATARRLPA